MVANRSVGAVAAVICSLVVCLASFVMADEPPETQRTWWQAMRGYYDPTGGWETYKTCRTEMGQPLKYTESEFKHLSISEIDAFAREAKKAYDLYQRYVAAMNQVGLKTLSNRRFWCLPDDKETAVTVLAEDTAKKWPTYKTNMARMGRPYKSADEFLQLSADERNTLFNESQGNSRSIYQGVTGYYSATDGWNVYQECRRQMGQPLDYSEYDFIHLSIPVHVRGDTARDNHTTERRAMVAKEADHQEGGSGGGGDRRSHHCQEGH